MPIYAYKAVTGAGEVVEGTMDARSDAIVIERLQSSGHLPIRVSETGAETGAQTAAKSSGGLFQSKRVKREEIMEFTRELATLLRAGLPLDRCLDIMSGMASRAPVAELIVSIQAEVRGGAPLSAALEKHKNVFDRFYLNMIRAGEAGGALDVVLFRLTDFMERAKELRETVTSAMIYPIILACVSVLSVLLLLMFVVPQFTQMFDQAGKSLPVPTQIVIAAGNFVRGDWWVILIGAVAIVWLMRRQLSNPVSRLRWDRWFLGLPLFGEMILKLDVARLTRTLGTLLENGVTLLSGLSIAKETVGNAVLRESLDQVTANLREGKGLGKPLMQTGLFPKLAVHMVMVGEETGRLQELLIQVANVYDREAQTTIKRLLALMEPILILSLGLMIGGIIMSILLAILSVNNLAFS
ncbi:MAG: type II secretion system F family protein [Thiomonas sp.]|uniref:type II secretion system F family protein n=1 Tax=Thiomonas sp. TaxID=2047785 RepID=UPI002A358B0E|nr:type II secretion system F family protein [Thiomonas sp.]MDY0330444.1 type II secretion system F family protein [Thiomonas sp.]